MEECFEPTREEDKQMPPAIIAPVTGHQSGPGKLPPMSSTITMHPTELFPPVGHFASCKRAISFSVSLTENSIGAITPTFQETTRFGNRL